MGRVPGVDASCRIRLWASTFISIDFDGDYNDDGRVEILLASDGVDSAGFSN